MNKWVYNSCVGAGVAAVGVGVGASWTWSVGLATAGALVIGLTVFGAWLSMRSAG